MWECPFVYFKNASMKFDFPSRHHLFHKDHKILVFNGTLYNCEDLKRDLTQRGHSFETASDLEILLSSYIEYGKECTSLLRGMFAFIIYDLKTHQIFGATDHFGIKPLYYTENNDFLAFACEYKALLPVLKTRTVNEGSLQSYLSFQFVPMDKTMLHEVRKAPAGCYFEFIEDRLSFTAYHLLDYQTGNVTKEDISKVIEKSVKSHMKGHTEIGTFLSGGIDSSIIATLASQFKPDIKSFTIGFDVEGYSEIYDAKKTAKKLGIKNYHHVVTQQEYIEALPDIVSMLDDPMADPSAPGVYFASKEAAKHVKVVMSGEGADEFFGGYNIYKEYYDIKYLSKLPGFLKKIIHWTVKILPSFKGKNYCLRGTSFLKDRYIGNAKIFENKQVKKVMNHYNPNDSYQTVIKPLYDFCEKQGYDYITTMQYIDMKTWLQGDILIKGAKMSRPHSLEYRVPFLDKEVWRIANKLTLTQKVTPQKTKALLREAFSGKIPQHTVEKKKLGFPTPIRAWLKSDLGVIVEKTMTEADVDMYINKKFVLDLLKKHIANKKDHSRKIWTVFIFCLWHQITIEQKSISFDAKDKPLEMPVNSNILSPKINHNHNDRATG